MFCIAASTSQLVSYFLSFVCTRRILFFCATVWNLAETRKRLVPSRMPKASGGFGGRDLLSWLPI